MASPSIPLNHLTEQLGEWRAEASSDYAALAERIRLLTIDGRIKAGMRLPSERRMAEHFGVSRTTVNSALGELRKTGYARSRQGSGTVITIPGMTGDIPIPHAGDLLDLSRATSAAAPGLYAAAERALQRLSARLGTDGYELAGLPSLREAIADKYTTAGQPTSPDQILITNGAAGAISLIARTLVSVGDRVLVETPGYPHSNEAFRAVSARLVPTIVDGDDGWDLTHFTQTVALSSPRVAYLMPDFHNPTSRSMSIATREKVVHTARRHGMLIVADETTADLSLNGDTHIAPLGASDEWGETVISVGSASKTIWGGLRVGWIRAAEQHINRLHAARFSYDLGVSVLDQLTVSEMIENLPEVLAYRRGIHRQSADALRAALQEHLPEARLHSVAGGVAAWIDLNTPISSALTVAARSRGLLIGAGPWFGLNGEFELKLRIPITAPPPDITRAIAILAEARRDLPQPVGRSARHAS
ncbi:PLP-dependent aminotransferase family protein [Salinibacterium sp. G-O1]|uniref:MocR-like transcription factor YczR n=1 Tax=Salinibacterium sp. G-O1 TaxID=3046208 RepID=UPI0024BB55E1|nr:PLP-dependent aminotransferase family protein [Salinibacterium sp. G-O1]MDJ0335346.1 PLP-dependent aminotransferase family protein [Salinibacterium sp. G-O1]